MTPEAETKCANPNCGHPREAHIKSHDGDLYCSMTWLSDSPAGQRTRYACACEGGFSEPPTPAVAIELPQDQIISQLYREKHDLLAEIASLRAQLEHWKGLAKEWEKDADTATAVLADAERKGWNEAIEAAARLFDGEWGPWLSDQVAVKVRALAKGENR